MNEPLAAIMVGLLLSLSSGMRITLPLLAVCLLAFEHVIVLPHDMLWLGTQTTLIILSVAAAAETLVHFVPAAGTWVRAAATPLAFVAGTLLMAVPLGDKSPLIQWIMAGTLGGGAATLTHLGFTGMRAVTSPANLASGGMFGVGWNLAEIAASIFFIALSGICVVAGWVFGAAVLALLFVAFLVLAVKSYRRWSRSWAKEPTVLT
jgi:hypothetical protein